MTAEDFVDSGSSSMMRRVGRGVSWSALSTIILRLGQFIMGIVIARLVAPQEFGIFVVALTVLAIVANVSDLGLASAVIREVGRTRIIAPTVATIAIAASAVLTGVMFGFAPQLASALGSSAATQAVQLLSLTVLIGSFGAVPGAILVRDYQQGRKFAADGTSFIVSNIVLIVLALSGAGVLALVWSRIAGQVVSTVMLIVLARERYWPGFDRSEAGRLLKFSLPLAGASLVGFSIGNADFIAVGRISGATSLGTYNLAFNISSWPVSIFTSILNSVTLTTLSRAKGSADALRSHLRAALTVLASLSFPVTAICIALAYPLVELLYGERWILAAPLLAVLSVFGSIRVILALLSDLIVALGHSGLLVVLQLIWIAGLIPALVIFVSLWGAVGAAWANVAVAVVIVVPAYLVVVRLKAKLGMSWIFPSIIVPAIGAIACGFVAAWTSQLSAAPVLMCLIGGASGLVTYLLVTGYWLRGRIGHLRGLYGHGVGPDIIGPVAPDQGTEKQ